MTTSLRDLKKAATARELAATAFVLVQERGYDDVTIDQIAEHAGYSRRTFANHFGGKAEAVVDGFLQRFGPQVLDSRTAPRTMSDLLDASEAFIASLLEGPALDDVRAFAAIAREHPVVESMAHSRLQAFRGSANIALLVERFGETRTMLYLSALVGLLAGSLHVVLDELGATCADAAPAAHGRPQMPEIPDLTPELRDRLRALVTEAFDILRHGFLAGAREDASPAP
ncbi:TetR/AcrR family transcriptional regulator [Sanguibacter sp. HDW7]|uniref:TetR/AcrR family transcriptional regulator n=1 Tax=Sanguibacter sp. HDW7 TaxID=2714931 RepID=UPI0014087B03|nr:TetR/AcrR family transcriptional regulator [Sanguibacter sp. HDW7]QIK82313.1 TetR family transcriptional regulator [Sanguibacter sp. HDW7]